MSDTNIRDEVKSRYGKVALRVIQPSPEPLMAGTDPIVRDLYSAEQTAKLPEEAVRASLGCGNPTMLAQLRPGEVVLDLGSGGGIDVLLSAQKVGPAGKAYGLDMTDEMLSLARENQKKAGAENVEFLKGTIEEIPLPDASVDVIISNCVINLSADKDKVLREAFRVLKPGGRFAVSDIVLQGELPERVKKSLDLWAGCVSGALEENDYKSKLASAGFQNVSLTTTRTYSAGDAVEMSQACCGVDSNCCAPGENKVTPKMLNDLSQACSIMVSSFIKAEKP
jgi:arsenite methyltransferase